MSRTYSKDPDAVLDYTFDWSKWLVDGELISATEIVTSAPGITIDSYQIISGNNVTVWISGGNVHEFYSVTVRIVTNQGRTDDRTFSIIVQER